MYQKIYVLLFFACFFTPGFSQVMEKPNVILVVVDDLGWKDVGFMGSAYYETPNLDRLASQSIRFTNAYAGAANCAPSRACLLTGQNTPRHGIYTVAHSDRGHVKTRKLIPTQNTVDLSQQKMTLAEVLQQNGYTTATMGKWHLGADPTTQGFDLNIGGNRRGAPKSYFSPYQNPELTDGPEGEYLTDRLTTEAINFIEKNRNNPFFLYLPYFTIHTPLQGKQELVAKYEQKASIDEQGKNPHYAAMVETMDANIGRILEQLEDLNLDNTLVIFTSDNGGIAYLSRQYPLRAGKGSYYEGGIRVPLLVHWKARSLLPAIYDDPVKNLDLFPTILDLLEIPYPENQSFDGTSLANLIMKGKPLKKRPLFWHFPIYLEAYSKGNDDSRDPLFRTRPGSIIRLGKWKLHEYFEDGGIELYNLDQDPGERNDLSQSRKGKARKLYRILQNWRAETDAPVPTELNPTYEAGFEP